MKKIIFLSFIFLLSSLSAYNPVRGLGNSFNLLIPDTEVDTRTFADRLARQNYRYAQVITNTASGNTSYYAISPLAGDFKTRHDLQLKAFSSSNYAPDRININQKFRGDFLNYAALKLGKFCLGVEASQKIIDDSYSSQKDYYNFSSYSVNTENRRNERDNSTNISNFGISTGIGRENSLSLAFHYTSAELDNSYNSISENIRIYHEPNETNTHNQTVNESSLGDSTSYRFALIKDMGNDGKSRFFLEVNFFESDGCETRYINRIYETTGSDFTNYEESSETEEADFEQEGTSLCLGLGSSSSLNRFDFYFAGKLSLSKIEYSATHQMNEESLVDSVLEVADPITYISEVSEEKGSLTIPLGMIYNFRKWGRFMASFTMKTLYQKTEVKDNPEFDDPQWEAKVYQNIGWEFYPVTNLELGVYNMNNLSDYREWELSVRYKF